MLENKPLVSFIITVGDNYNFLKESILSLLNQTYKETEVIIINDGNYEEVIKIVDLFNSPKIFLFNYPKNGRGKSLNIGIRKAKGELISILDSDDIAHPNRLEIQINFYFKGYQTIFTKFTTDYNLFLSLKLKNSLNFDLLKNRQFIFRNPVCHSSLLINKKLLKNYLYDESRKNLFDYDLWINLLIDKNKLIIINQILTFKRIHSMQAYENKKRLFYIYSTFSLKFKAYKFFKKSSLDFLILLFYTFYSLLPQKIRAMLMGKF